MKKRVLTGVVYVIVMIALLALKIYVPGYKPEGASDTLYLGSLGVDLLFWAISVVGAFEFLRAVKDVSKKQRIVAMVTCSLIIPAFVITKLSFMAAGSTHTSEASLIMLLSVTSVGMMAVASLMVFDFQNSNLKSTALAEMCILYCGALTSVGPNINHLSLNPTFSVTAIILLFFITPAVDTFAFFFGSLLGKKFPRKLAPHTSPNKTLVGAIGGVIGGVFAAVLVWLVTEYLPGAQFDYPGKWHKLAVLVVISVPTSIFAQLGDLFESAIKRGCGIKDMGNALPGHGGVLDRFDSMLFATVSIVVCFMLVR